MDIAPQLLQVYPTLNTDQRTIISHESGPLLVIAGPGSGKTRSLILRAMNILLLDKARPSELVLCTYTDKAANEMHNRLVTLAREVGYQGDLFQLRVGTIHSICNQLIMEHRHHTKLGNDYEQLDQFAQQLFIFRHLDTIGQRGALHIFSEKWGTKWEIAKRLQKYFDKIMEELIEVHKLLSDQRPFQRHLGNAYNAYCTLLMRENRVSFAALLKIAHDLVSDPKTAHKITSKIGYVFVDEYQDTNYIQEQIILKLASATRNLCVVGDEDQALYRFRGATVRNLLEFKSTVPDCTARRLTSNYRSHADIVQRYDRWMASADWKNPGAKHQFRSEKLIEPNTKEVQPHYPAVLSIQGEHVQDEAEQFAEFVLFLKEQDIIGDYSQIALLLYSVKPEYSDVYVEALTKRNIPAFCPRARSYFKQEEISLLVACFAVLFGYSGEKQGDLLPRESFSLYIQKTCLENLHKYEAAHPLQVTLRELASEFIRQREYPEDQKSHKRPTDYFYRLLAIEPFATFAKDERKMRNLVIFSKVLHTFQRFYRHTEVSYEILDNIRFDFFHIFLRLLEDGGINEYEDEEQPFLQGHVQVMTIHQAKGLEFPVVIVGSLNERHWGAQKMDRELHPFYKRELFEPEHRIPGFDMMRLYYVAFSRAEKLLVLTGNRRRPPQKHFYNILDGLPQWPYIQNELLAMSRPKPKELPSIKRSYSFTSHVQMYETCPRQYQYFREYNFIPSRQKEVFLGLLVHQTIEEIHRIALDGRFVSLNEGEIRRILDRIYDCLCCTHPYQVDASTRESAFTQVYNYFRQNRREIQQVVETEVDITIEKDGYILTGRIDLLMKRNDKLELLDFKIGTRPKPDAEQLLDYERQLCTYAYALERRYKQRPERLLLYWTGETRREDALMEVRYRPEMVEQVNRSFDAIVSKIKEKDFRIVTVPERHVCTGCDIQHLCLNEGII